MEVEFNPGRIASLPPASAGAGKTVSRRETTKPAEEAMSFERTQALEQTLKNSPQVRPEAVARANALAGDASYPSDEQLNRIAGLLASNINS